MLKHTGIVRRMDDLGRIVFPKELRKQMGLKENDPFELGIAETEDGQKYLDIHSALPCHLQPRPSQ